MGLFSTTIHVYQKSQQDIITGIISILRKGYNLLNNERIHIDNSNFNEILKDKIYSNNGVFYLITEQNKNWTSIIELNVHIETPFFLYELTGSLSKFTKTFALMFHLYDGDVLLYNLAYQGQALDGYNSDPQYFLTEPLTKREIKRERHQPKSFIPILPEGKNSDQLNLLLNEGYWTAFDNDDLNEEGIPDYEKYFVDEEDRLNRICKYLEIFSKDEFPFACWIDGVKSLELTNCYLLRFY